MAQIDGSTATLCVICVLTGPGRGKETRVMNVTNARGKVGAILFRTSTSDQLEISPETQVKESSALADQTGYSIPSDYVIGCDCAS